MSFWIPVLIKDLQLEYRSLLTVNSTVAFVLSSLLLGFFILGVDEVTENTSLALYWIIILFAAILSINRSFVVESDRSTMELLQLHASPLITYTGKLLFNFLLISFISLVASAFLLIISTLNTKIDFVAFIVVILLSCAGLTGATTLISAIVAQTDRQASLFPMLALPMLTPLMLILANLSAELIDWNGWTPLLNSLFALIGYIGVTISASLVLFEYLWND
jgi:heme exporter protein B